MSKPPRLALPVVEEDVLPEGSRGGVGRGPSSADCLKEPLVEDRLRRSRRVESAMTGDVPPDDPSIVESLRVESPRA